LKSGNWDNQAYTAEERKNGVSEMEYDASIHSLECPKCQHGMEEVTHEGITIDRCTHCAGLWFDEDEAHYLKKIENSETLDSGDASEGKKWDTRVDINCPRCGNKMEETADPKQKHIWYEVCQEHGMFMDAGEFKDFKYESLLDLFRSLIKGDRSIVAP
jgi:Zn-finger nucleic acid-binding protein